MGLVVCLLFFAMVEAALRIAGFPPPDVKEDPFVGFSAIHPLFTVRDGKATVSPPRLRFFNEVSFPAEKPAKTMRIFAFGGSTTYGHPFDGRTSFCRWLQDLLKASAPDRDFEVINAGGISYASYRVVPLMREALRYRPDLMIVYTGQNEFLERRTYSGFFEQGQGLLTVRSMLDRLRIYRALERLLAPLVAQRRARSQEHARTQDGQAKKPVLKEEVTAILDRSAGLDLYHRDEEFAKGVVSHFEHNLRAMTALCREANVPLIFVQPACNLKDFSPFKSEHGPHLDARSAEALDRLLETARKDLEEGKYEDALRKAEELIAKDPLHAESHFRKARALQGLGRLAEAKESFMRAKDLDVCPLREVAAIEEKIDAVMQSEGVPLIPFRDRLFQWTAESGDKTGIPGNESFLDHVHPTIHYHQVIAELLAGKIEEMRLVRPSHTLTREERSTLYEKGMESLDPAFFATRDLNLAKVLRWAGKKAEAREALQRAVGQVHDNAEVHKMLGSFFLEDGRPEEAIREMSEAVRLSGEDPEMIHALAYAYAKAGSRDEAARLYRKLVDQGSDVSEAYANLGMLYLEEGRAADALAVTEPGVNRSPDSATLLGTHALALAISGKSSEAIPWMLKAVQAEPGDPVLSYNLACMYATAGKGDEALKHLDLAVDKGYRNAEKLSRDPAFTSLKDLPGFRGVLDRIR